MISVQKATNLWYNNCIKGCNKHPSIDLKQNYYTIMKNQTNIKEKEHGKKDYNNRTCYNH